MSQMAAKRVLLVDDDPNTRTWMSGYLAELGYEPHVALDGDHALRSGLLELRAAVGAWLEEVV